MELQKGISYNSIDSSRVAVKVVALRNMKADNAVIEAILKI
ncbi:hypothetical protein ACJDU8_06275 [Clostridium sp. WILCCON 0269]|uniref:Uncharacterized protein n=1 Tax=Candidatus Clostridium eludens TaxID=3381663 RepID=A0ABW8SGJ3_9CLOT